MYSQSGMTESPRPLSPGGTQANAAGQPRAGNEQQQGAPALSLPTHGMSPAAKQAWLSQYPPADRDAIQGNAAQGQQTASRGRARAASGATPAQVGENGNNFAQPDPNLWAYFQHLEGSVKRLSSQMETEARSKAQLLEKLNAHEQHIAALTAEIATLRQQFAPPPEEGSPADSAPAQQ